MIATFCRPGIGLGGGAGSCWKLQPKTCVVAVDLFNDIRSWVLVPYFLPKCRHSKISPVWLECPQRADVLICRSLLPSEKVTKFGLVWNCRETMRGSAE